MLLCWSLVVGHWSLVVVVVMLVDFHHDHLRSIRHTHAISHSASTEMWIISIENNDDDDRTLDADLTQWIILMVYSFYCCVWLISFFFFLHLWIHCFCVGFFVQNDINNLWSIFNSLLYTVTLVNCVMKYKYGV